MKFKKIITGLLILNLTFSPIVAKTLRREMMGVKILRTQARFGFEKRAIEAYKQKLDKIEKIIKEYGKTDEISIFNLTVFYLQELEIKKSAKINLFNVGISNKMLERARKINPETDAFVFNVLKDKYDCNDYSIFLYDIFKRFNIDVDFFVGPDHVVLIDHKYIYDGNNGVVIKRNKYAEKYFSQFEIDKNFFLTASYGGLMSVYTRKYIEARKQKQYSYMIEIVKKIRNIYSEYKKQKPENLKATDTDIYYGYFLFEINDRIGMKKVFRKCYLQNPDKILSNYLIGFSYDINGKRKTALKFYKKTKMLFDKNKVNKQTWEKFYNFIIYRIWFLENKKNRIEMDIEKTIGGLKIKREIKEWTKKEIIKFIENPKIIYP